MAIFVCQWSGVTMVTTSMSSAVQHLAVVLVHFEVVGLSLFVLNALDLIPRCLKVVAIDVADGDAVGEIERLWANRPPAAAGADAAQHGPVIHGLITQRGELALVNQ